MPRRTLKLLALSLLFGSSPFACSSGGGTVTLFRDGGGGRDARADSRTDGASLDASTRDTSTSDSGVVDSSVKDGAASDASTADAPMFDAHVECTVSGPTSIGPIPAGMVVDDGTIGTRTWSIPSNAGISDDAYATISAMSSSDESHYLLATDFGFDIPQGAIITGFTVETERRGGTSFNVVDNFVRIVKGGVIGVQDRATGPAWGAFDTTATYGGTNDTWGLAFTPDDVNASDFGVAYSARNAAGTAGVSAAFVDAIRVTVHLSCP